MVQIKKETTNICTISANIANFMYLRKTRFVCKLMPTQRAATCDCGVFVKPVGN